MPGPRSSDGFPPPYPWPAVGGPAGNAASRSRTPGGTPVKSPPAKKATPTAQGTWMPAPEAVPSRPGAGPQGSTTGGVAPPPPPPPPPPKVAAQHKAAPKALLEQNEARFGQGHGHRSANTAVHVDPFVKKRGGRPETDDNEVFINPFANIGRWSEGPPSFKEPPAQGGRGSWTFPSGSSSGHVRDNSYFMEKQLDNMRRHEERKRKMKKMQLRRWRTQYWKPEGSASRKGLR